MAAVRQVAGFLISGLDLVSFGWGGGQAAFRWKSSVFWVSISAISWGLYCFFTRKCLIGIPAAFNALSTNSSRRCRSGLEWLKSSSSIAHVISTVSRVASTKSMCFDLILLKLLALVDLSSPFLTFTISASRIFGKTKNSGTAFIKHLKNVSSAADSKASFSYGVCILGVQIAFSSPKMIKTVITSAAKSISFII